MNVFKTIAVIAVIFASNYVLSEPYWAAKYPPSEWELKRKKRIEELQGN